MADGEAMAISTKASIIDERVLQYVFKPNLYP